MTQYHAVILDECGQEFGVTVQASNKSAAYEQVREDYPENMGIIQTEDAQDTREREAEIYARVSNDDYDY